MWSGSSPASPTRHGAWHGVSDSRTILELHEGPLGVQIVRPEPGEVATSQKFPQ